MIEINLIPDVKQELIKAQRIRSTVIKASITSGALVVALVAVLAIYIFAVQAVRGKITGDLIKTKGEELSQVEDLSKMLTIQNQLTKITGLNNSKKIDSRIFDVLAAIIPSEPNFVQISSLNIDSTTNTISMDGQAKNSFPAVEIFKKTIESAIVSYSDANFDPQEVPLASNISTGNVSYGEDASGNKVLRFSLSFVYPTELFSPISKDISINAASGNVTDSYLGIPKSLFTSRAADIKGAQ